MPNPCYVPRCVMPVLRQFLRMDIVRSIRARRACSVSSFQFSSLLPFCPLFHESTPWYFPGILGCVHEVGSFQMPIIGRAFSVASNCIPLCPRDSDLFFFVGWGHSSKGSC